MCRARCIEADSRWWSQAGRRLAEFPFLEFPFLFTGCRKINRANAANAISACRTHMSIESPFINKLTAALSQSQSRSVGHGRSRGQGRGLVACGLALLLAACAGPGPRPPEEIKPPDSTTSATWQHVPGWQDDELAGVASALQQNCLRLAQRAQWRHACAAAEQLDALDLPALRVYFETYFTPVQLTKGDGSPDGLVTGYYEPLLRGSRTRRGSYQYALYRWPAGYRSNALLPPRAQLAGLLQGNELVWVDDPVEAFFLQVQGSGRIVMDDGSVMRVGYGGTNNQPYKSIGQWLIAHGELSVSQATMQGIKAWARANPSRVESVLNMNPRFVFFKEMTSTEPAPLGGAGGADGPIGALGVPLTPQRSIAVDPAEIPLGAPVFLQTTWPLSNQPLNRLVFAQDTGTAIKGGVRADYFWGLGDDAGDLAGKMKQTARMWLLLPKP